MVMPQSLAFAAPSSLRDRFRDLYKKNEATFHKCAYNILLDDVEADKAISDAFALCLDNPLMIQISDENLREVLLGHISNLAQVARRRRNKKSVRQIGFVLAAFGIGSLGGFGPKWFPAYAGLFYGLTALLVLLLFLFASSRRFSRKRKR